MAQITRAKNHLCGQVSTQFITLIGPSLRNNKWIAITLIGCQRCGRKCKLARAEDQPPQAGTASGVIDACWPEELIGVSSVVRDTTEQTFTEDFQRNHNGFVAAKFGVGPIFVPSGQTRSTCL